MRRLARAFVMGAVLFPFLDGLHTHLDVLSYARPWILRMAWWVPLEFGAMWVVVAVAVPQLERAVAVDPPTADTSTLTALAETAIFVVAYTATAILDSRGTLVVVVALGVPLIARLAVHARKRDWVFVLAGAALGPLGECIVSSTGAFAYHHPELWRVPAWLPVLWAHGGFFARRLFRHRLLAP